MLGSEHCDCLLPRFVLRPEPVRFACDHQLAAYSPTKLALAPCPRYDRRTPFCHSVRSWTSVAAFSDHYRTLNVHRHAEPAVIEAAYRALARRYHPDLNPGDKAAPDRLRGINAAYAVLASPAARRSYDLTWDTHHAPKPPKPSPQRPQQAQNQSASSTKQQTHRANPPAPPPQPTAASGKSVRPWYVKILGFVVIVALLRAGAAMVSTNDFPAVSQPVGPGSAKATATFVPKGPPTKAAFAPALDFELQATVAAAVPTASTQSGTKWGFVETFADASTWEQKDNESAASYVDASGLVVTIKTPGGFDGYLYDALPSAGKDVAFGVVAGSFDGWGEINLILRDAAGTPEWLFGIDPVAREWNLYRTSDTTSQFFYWVEPRPFGAVVNGAVRTIEARVIGGIPGLWINGVDVVRPTGISMPEMSGSLVFGMGAGINPESLTGSGDWFSVTFERVELREL